MLDELLDVIKMCVPTVQVIAIVELLFYLSLVNGLCPASNDGKVAVERDVTFGRDLTLFCEIPSDCNRGVWRKRDSPSHYEDILEDTCGVQYNNDNICHNLRGGRNALDIHNFRWDDTGCFVCQCDNFRTGLTAKTVAKFNLNGVCWMTVSVQDALTEFNNSLGRAFDVNSWAVNEEDDVTIECQAWAQMETNCTDNRGSPFTLRIRALPEHDFCWVWCVSHEGTHSHSDCTIKLVLRVILTPMPSTSSHTPTTLAVPFSRGIEITTNKEEFIPRETPATEQDVADSWVKPDGYPDTNPGGGGSHVAILLPLVTLVLFLLIIVIGLCCYLYSPIFDTGRQKSFKEQATAMVHWNGAVNRHRRISAREIVRALEVDDAFDIELTELPFPDASLSANIPVCDSCTYGIRLNGDATGEDGVTNTCGNNNLIHLTCEDDYCSMHSYNGSNVEDMPLRQQTKSRAAERRLVQRSYSEHGPRDHFLHRNVVDGEINSLVTTPHRYDSRGIETGFNIIRRSYPVTGKQEGVTYYRVIGHGSHTRAKSAQNSPQEQGSSRGFNLQQRNNPCAKETEVVDAPRSNKGNETDGCKTYYHVFDDAKEIVATTQESRAGYNPLPNTESSETPELPPKRYSKQFYDMPKKRGSSVAETEYNVVGRSEREERCDSDATASEYATVIRCDQPSQMAADRDNGMDGIDQEVAAEYDDVRVDVFGSEASATADSDIYASIMQK